MKYILGATSNRLAIVARYFMHTGGILQEQRGADWTKLQNKEITDLIKAHIKSYKCRKSYYSRATTCRFIRVKCTTNVDVVL